MLQVASELVRLRTEGDRVAENQLTNGVILVSARRQASAATYKAQADLLQANWLTCSLTRSWSRPLVERLASDWSCRRGSNRMMEKMKTGGSSVAGLKRCTLMCPQAPHNCGAT